MRLIALRILGADGSGTTSWTVDALNYLISLLRSNSQMKVAAVNLSLGGYASIPPARAQAILTIWRAYKIPHRNIPQRHVAEKANITHVTVNGRATTCSTAYSMPGIRANFGYQAAWVFSNRMYSKTLQINRLFDYLLYKHEFLSG